MFSKETTQASPLSFWPSTGVFSRELEPGTLLLGYQSPHRYCFYGLLVYYGQCRGIESLVVP